MDVLVIEDLKKIVTTLSPTQCDFLSENCITTLENSNHKSGCFLSVQGDTEKQFCLEWKKEFEKAGYKEKTKIVEHASETIAFFLSASLTDYTIVEESVIGTGFDYWLAYDEAYNDTDPENFLHARLEVSGIYKENTTNTLEKRVEEKKAQTKKSDNLQLPAYIAVTEFSTPKAFFGKK
jgi:hypothetical protein